MSGRSSRNKGYAYEREIRDLFRQHFAWLEIPPERMAGSGAFTNLRSDINFFGQIPLKVECKRVENLSVNAWLKQAKDQAEDGEDWMLIFRRSHEKSVAMLDANLAVEALGSLYSQKGPGIRN